jgi:transposase
MLSKPGAARSKPTPTQRRGRKVEETPDELLRKLQRLPGNKACADCGGKVRTVRVHLSENISFVQNIL